MQKSANSDHNSHNCTSAIFSNNDIISAYRSVFCIIPILSYRNLKISILNGQDLIKTINATLRTLLNKIGFLSSKTMKNATTGTICYTTVSYPSSGQISTQCKRQNSLQITVQTVLTFLLIGSQESQVSTDHTLRITDQKVPNIPSTLKYLLLCKQPTSFICTTL